MESQPLEAHELHQHEDGSSTYENLWIQNIYENDRNLAVIKKTMFPIHEYYSSRDSTQIIILPMLILAGMIIVGVNEYWSVHGL